MFMKEILKYIFVLAAGQSVLIAIFLSKKNENRIANKYLVTGNFIFALDLLFLIFYIEKLYFQFPYFVGFNIAFPYFYGPEVYLYTRAIKQNDKSITFKDLLHFIPFVSVILFHFIALFFIKQQLLIGIPEGMAEPPFTHIIIGNLIPVSGIIYLILTFKNMREINRKLKIAYSYIGENELKWMHIIVYGAACVWLSVIVAYSLNLMVGHEFNGEVIIYGALSIFVFVLSYNSYKQPQWQIKGDEPEKINESYKKSTLSEESAQQYISKLFELLEKEKLYTTNNLSLRDLSDKLDITTHLLSEIINTKLNKNFYDLINGYRIEEVKRLIEEDKEAKFNIIALAYDAGFSSKTTFNNLFKKYTNLTPSEYRAVVKAK